MEVRIKRFLLITLFFLIYSVAILIASAPVRNASNNSQASAAGTTGVVNTITIAAGHNVYVAAYQDANSSLVPTFTDSNSNTYTTIKSISVGSAQLYVATKVNLPSQITTVTTTWNTSTAITMAAIVEDVTGAITTNNGVDDNANAVVTATASSTSTSLTSGNATTNQSADLLFNFTGEATTSSGWAVCGSGGNGFGTGSGETAASRRLGASNKTVSSPGSQGTTCESWTTTGGDRLSILISLASVAPTSCKPNLSLLGVGC